MSKPRRDYSTEAAFYVFAALFTATLVHGLSLLFIPDPMDAYLSHNEVAYDYFGGLEATAVGMIGLGVITALVLWRRAAG